MFDDAEDCRRIKTVTLKIHPAAPDNLTTMPQTAPHNPNIPNCPLECSCLIQYRYPGTDRRRLCQETQEGRDAVDALYELARARSGAEIAERVIERLTKD